MLRFEWFAFPMLFYCPLIFFAVYFASKAAGIEDPKAKYIGIASALAPFPLHVIWMMW